MKLSLAFLVWGLLEIEMGSSEGWGVSNKVSKIMSDVYTVKKRTVPSISPFH
jgi:hypothetical protein